MKTMRTLFRVATGLLAGVVLRAAEAPPAPATPEPAKPPANLPLSPRFKQVRERIDALFHLRNDAPPAPDPRGNPFRPAGPSLAPPPGAVTPSAPIALETAPAGDQALLLAAVGTLKITGGVERGGDSLIGINAKLYKKGDVVQAVVQGQPVYLRVREVSGRTATLVLNDAETTVKF